MTAEQALINAQWLQVFLIAATITLMLWAITLAWPIIKDIAKTLLWVLCALSTVAGGAVMITVVVAIAVLMGFFGCIVFGARWICRSAWRMGARHR